MIKRYISGMLVMVMLITMIPAVSVQAAPVDDYTEVTEEMCAALVAQINVLAENFGFNSATQTGLTTCRTTYDNYLRWDELAEKQTTKEQVSEETVKLLTDMEDADRMIRLLSSCYDVIEPFEGLSSFFDVSEEEFYHFKSVSEDSESDLSKFVGHFAGETDESVLAFFERESSAVSEKSSNKTLGEMVQSVYMFVENNEPVFSGVSAVRHLLAAAPETGAVTKAVYEETKPLVEAVGDVVSRFEDPDYAGTLTELNTRVARLTGNTYTTLVDLYEDYSVQCMKIGFEKQIDDLYEEIYSSMDITTLSSDEAAISALEEAYDQLPRNVQERIVNLGMLQKLRDKYEKNKEIYETVVVPAQKVSEHIEKNFWELCSMRWPVCADVMENDAETVEKNLIAADVLVSEVKSAYDKLTSAQKKYVTTVSYLEYMKNTYQTMNLRYMTDIATLLYKKKNSDQLIYMEEDAGRALKWLDTHISAGDRAELEQTLVDENSVESDVVSVIQQAVAEIAALRERSGKETELAIRRLVTLEGNEKGYLISDEIRTVYELFVHAVSNEYSAAFLTDNSKYEIEALYYLAELAQKAEDAIGEAAAIDPSTKESQDIFVEQYQKASCAVDSFDVEFARTRADFISMEDGSEVCLNETTSVEMIPGRQDLISLSEQMDIISEYERIGDIQILDDATVKIIQEAWTKYLSIIGEDTEEDICYAGRQLRVLAGMAAHVSEFMKLVDGVCEAPQTAEEQAALLAAEDYYRNVLTEKEKSFVGTSYVDKLSGAKNFYDETQTIIRMIDNISAPVEDAGYQQFSDAVDAAWQRYGEWVSKNPEGRMWIVNADRLDSCVKAKKMILTIRELLQTPSSQMCESLTAISDAVKQYEEMPTLEQNMVYNDMDLYLLWQEVGQADAVSKLLSQLIVFTLADEPAVTGARKQYDSLSERAKQYVNNYIILVMAEKQLDALKKNAETASSSQTVQTDASESASQKKDTASGSTAKISIKKAVIKGYSKKLKIKSKKKLSAKKVLIRKKLVVRLNGRKLKKNQDYSIQFKTNSTKTKLSLIVKGKGTYKDTKRVAIQIVYSKKV